MRLLGDVFGVVVGLTVGMVALVVIVIELGVLARWLIAAL
jgi:hypothetical protein